MIEVAPITVRAPTAVQLSYFQNQFLPFVTHMIVGERGKKDNLFSPVFLSMLQMLLISKSSISTVLIILKKWKKAVTPLDGLENNIT